MTATRMTRVLLPTTCLATILTMSCGHPDAVVSSAPTASVAVTSRSTLSSPSARPTSPVPDPTGTSSPGATTAQPSPTEKPAPALSCAKLASSLTLRQRVGQLFMVGVSSAGLTARDARVLASGQVGSVILLDNSRAGAAATRRITHRVRAATPTPRHISTMLAADQEGGLIQRLRGPGFTTIPSARRQAKLSNSALARDAASWGRQLKAAGIDANLAPVADVVPAGFESVNQPIGVLKRGYGPDPHIVAYKVGAFVRGMHRAAVVTAVKHFPGLGRVRGNTDFAAHVVDGRTTRHDRYLAGFGGAVSARVDMVMVSSAYYSKIDASRRAAFSPVVIGVMIRHDLGFRGVVISDDLSARAVQDVTPGRRALRFLGAGGDLVIVGHSRTAPPMISAVISSAAASRSFSAAVTAKATRVLTMKAHRGLVHCS